MIVLYVVALVAELAGLALAADGFRRTWREFRRPDDAFWEPVAAPAKQAARSAYVRARRLIGKSLPPAEVKVVGVTGSATVGVPTVTATGFAVPPVEDVAAYMTYLSHRIDDLSRQIARADAAARAKTESDAQRHAETTRTIEQVQNEMHGQVRTITIEGMREQALGWLLIVIGTFLGGLGNIIAAT